MNQRHTPMQLDETKAQPVLAYSWADGPWKELVFAENFALRAGDALRLLFDSSGVIFKCKVVRKAADAA